MNMFWKGIRSGYPLCCVIFFCDVWCKLRESKKMFSGRECHNYNSNAGFIQCPECICRELEC